MKTTVNKYEFCEMFRAIRPDNFSYNGLEALFEYLEQLEEDLGEEIEVDVIALCCDYTEWGHWQELAENYAVSGDDEEIAEYAGDNCQVIEFEGGIITSAF